MLYPGIHIKISNHSTPQAVDAIKNGIADIAVVTTPTLPSAMIEEVTVRRFHEVAVCSSAFSELLESKVSFAELLSYPMISLGTQTKSFELYSEFFANVGLRFRPEIEAATADQILPLVKNDLGIGFVPEERRKFSILPTITIRENLSAAIWDRLFHFPNIDRPAPSCPRRRTCAAACESRPWPPRRCRGWARR